jgi:hypothetical protein
LPSHLGFNVQCSRFNVGGSNSNVEPGTLNVENDLMGRHFATICGQYARVSVEAVPFITGIQMITEKIQVRITESRQTIDVVVFSKRADVIEVVIGEGIHNVKCALTPTRNGLAYVGSVMGREIVYERSREKVQADIDRLNPALRKPQRR